MNARLDQAKDALAKVRVYAADHSADLNATIDKIGNFIDAQTGGKFAEKVDKAQAFGRRRVDDLAGHPEKRAKAARAFGVQEDGVPTWTQPPSSNNAQAGASGKGTPLSKDDLAKAMAKLRAFGAEHADNIGQLVEKVGDVVDKTTKGKYSDKIDQVQGAAKRQVSKLKKTDPQP